MKKLLIVIITIMIVLFIPACSLSASTTTNSNVSTSTTTEDINQDYVFTSMSQEITVVSEKGEILSNVKMVYTHSSGGYNITTTTLTLNSLDSSSTEAFSEKTTVSEVEDLDVYIFSTSDFAASEISTDGLNTTLTGTLSESGINNIGLDSSEYTGTVTISIENYNSKLTTVEVLYMSSSGNTITITTQLT